MTTAIANTDIEAELSYAFLHAVASQSQASCKAGERLSDNRGIDAHLTSWGPFHGAGAKQEVDLKVQLKATVANPTDLGTHFSYTLKKVAHYDDLRAMAYSVPRILVVLFLPRDKESWLSVTDHSLALKRSAYWVSLAGAPKVTTASATVHIPKRNLLTPESLRGLLTDISVGKIPCYEPLEVK